MYVCTYIYVPDVCCNFSLRSITQNSWLVRFSDGLSKRLFWPEFETNEFRKSSEEVVVAYSSKKKQRSNDTILVWPRRRVV